MSIPTYSCLGIDHFRPRGTSDSSRDETRIWRSLLQAECSEFEIPKNQPLIQEEVNKLLKKAVAAECEHKPVEYISSIFLREKTDGTQRLIVNLKNLDKHWNKITLKCKHFRQL